MKLIVIALIGILALLFPKALLAFQAPMELSSWQILENSIFDNPSSECLERDGPSMWEERTDGIGILIEQSLPCQTVITPKDTKYFGLRRFSLVFTMQIDDAGHDHNILILWKDRNNFSDFHLIGQNIEYEKIVNGKPVYSVSTRLQLGPRSTHVYRVEHDESTGITKLWRDDVAIFTVIEPENTPELPDAWVGFRASVGEQRTSDVTFSHFNVENLGKTYTTTTSLIKQNDSRWGHLEYDTATLWSNDKPTIARWGCALTSAIMVLRSYGITQLPDGSPLLPDTVNTWLLAQTDGYFGEGHLNWRALTRLVLEIHKIYSTTKLEFSYELPENKLSWLKETLALGKPIILDLDGHFVVTHQAGAGEKDFLIHDPLYTIFTLKEYGNTYLSARLFTPSQTDLSAISIVAPLNATLTFTTTNNTELQVTKILLPPVGKSAHSPIQLYDLPKPPDQNISIRVQSSAPQPIPLTFFSYSRTGEISKKEILVTVSHPTGIQLETHWSQENQMQTLSSTPMTETPLQLLSMSTPFLEIWRDEWKRQLHNFDSLETAQKWLAGVTWILDQSWKSSWLSSVDRQLLLLELRTELNKKFP